MKRLVVVLAALSFLFTGLPARAGEGPDFVGDKTQIVTDYMKFARDHITQAHLLNGSNVPAETPGELKSPVIPLEDGERVVNRGILTATAEYCGLDWQRESYSPFMQGERKKKIWSDKQLAYIGLLHGIAQAAFKDTFSRRGPCSDKMKTNTQALLEKLNK